MHSEDPYFPFRLQTGIICKNLVVKVKLVLACVRALIKINVMILCIAHTRPHAGGNARLDARQITRSIYIATE